MKQIKSLFMGICVSGVLLFVPVLVFGQGSIEPSYEVSLQLLMGSNDAGQKTSLPGNLTSMSQQIGTRYSFSSYRLAGTFLSRISNNGDYYYKSLSNLFGPATDYRSQSFLEWNVKTLKNGTTAKGQGYNLQAFNFGARVPVTTGYVKDQAGKDQPVINYESIGLNLNRIGVPENSPTLIGTINLPGAGDTIFLVMTVKPVDL